MSDIPLISVVTPTYQSVGTLPRAYRSLLSQTYEHWEWVVVNDGSTDETSEFLASLSDSRVRVLTLEGNRGRGYVRNLALAESRGEFVCALDADDWFYSHKLEVQVAAFQSDPFLTAVTLGMAVTDQDGALIGVQGRVEKQGIQTVGGPRELRFPFGPTMYRADIAKETGFRGGLRRGADLDFFIRLLCGKGRDVCHLPTLGYVYQGHTSSTLSELLSGHHWSRKVYLGHIGRFPRECAYLIVNSLLKSLVYKGSRWIRWSDRLSRRRFSPYLARDFEQYRDELELLEL